MTDRLRDENARPPMGPRIAAPLATTCGSEDWPTAALPHRRPRSLPGFDRPYSLKKCSSNRKSVTYLLNHLCYLCPDQAGLVPWSFVLSH